MQRWPKAAARPDLHASGVVPPSLSPDLGL
jgi:hypothetical protein